MQERMVCKQANQLDMVEYLEKLGHRPQKVRGNDYWYRSPLREEKTASFKIDRVKNVWYDHGIGKGGTLVDFGKLYFQCTVKELLLRLQDDKGISVSFHPQKNLAAGERKEYANRHGKVMITGDTVISNPVLKNYLAQRKIPLEIASKFCREISFEIDGKKHLAIGFQNPGGGYELRNHYFKGSSRPKEPKLIRSDNANELAVFEGFFNFLSYETLKDIRNKNSPALPKQQVDSLILNSLSFFEKSRELMEKYATVHLCLDRDKMGQQYTQKALNWSVKYKDQSRLYDNHKDLNDYLVKSANNHLKQSRNKGMRL